VEERVPKEWLRGSTPTKGKSVEMVDPMTGRWAPAPHLNCGWRSTLRTPAHSDRKDRFE